jgi:hypothetical protein
MWSPLIMPPEAYEELVNTNHIPLLIPKLPKVKISTEDLHYMSFEEAVLQHFSGEHQSLLQNCKNVNILVIGDVTLGDREPRSSASDANKITRQKFLRGVVKCKDYMKPRCLYSLTSPSRIKPHAIIGEAGPTAHAIRVCRGYAMQKFEEAQER